MRNRFQKVAAVCCVVLLGVGLAACGDDDEPDDDASSSVTAPEAVEGRVVFAIISQFLDLAQPILDSFEAEYPDVELVVESYPGDQYDTIVNTELAGDAGPDVFVSFAGSTVIRNGEDGVTENLAEEPWFDVPEGLFPLLGNADGVFAIPIGTVAQAAIYNEDVFEEHGVEVPTTFDEVLALCDTFNEAGVTPIGIAGNDPISATIPVTTIAASTVYVENPDFAEQRIAGETTFADEWGVALERFQELKDGGCFSDAAPGESLEQVEQNVADGSAAMTIVQMTRAPAIKSLNPEANIGLFPFPGGDSADDTQIVSAITAVWSAVADSDNRVGQMALLEWLTNAENAPKITAAAEMLPVNPTPADLPEGAELLAPIFEAGRTIANPSTVWPRSAEVAEAQQNGAQQIILGNADIREILEAMDKAFTE